VPPSFTLKLRDKQEYLHGTYAEKVFVPTEAFSSGFRSNLPPPLYELGSANNKLASYEARLLAAKVLLTRTQAEIEVERTDRTNDVLFGFESTGSLKMKKSHLSRVGRAAFEDALSANTAFARLLARKATKGDEDKLRKDPAFRVVLSGAKEFTLQHARWIHEGLQSETYTFRDLLKCQDMFLRSEVSSEEDMKVSDVGRLWMRNGKEVITHTRTEVGLWKVSPGMFNWAQKVETKLKEWRQQTGLLTLPRTDVARIYLDNREEVADDPLIVAKLEEISRKGLPTDFACVISQDKRLCKTAASRCGISIIRLSTYAMPLLFEGADMENKIMALEGNIDLIGEYVEFPQNPRIIHTMVDSGSLFEMLMKHVETDIGEGAKTYQFQTMRFFQDQEGKRHEVVSYTPTSTTGKVSFSLLAKKRDPNGNPLVEIIKPEKILPTRLPKFESYARGSDRSSRGSSSSTRRSKSSKRRGNVPSERE
jgi:hypothetical protein